MPRYRVYGTVTGSKYLGEFEAATPEEAAELALDENGYASLCHQCSGECEDPQVEVSSVELDEPEPEPAPKKRKRKAP